ncbi:hypothetical protein QYF36_018823 [Acer negundo]|nr:hypothetical protein QYF36_018823 [Acer negundo]
MQVSGRSSFVNDRSSHKSRLKGWIKVKPLNNMSYRYLIMPVMLRSSIEDGNEKLKAISQHASDVEEFNRRWLTELCNARKYWGVPSVLHFGDILPY